MTVARRRAERGGDGAAGVRRVVGGRPEVSRVVGGRADRVGSDAAVLSGAAARATGEAAVMLAAADPAVVGRPLPVIEVGVGKKNWAWPPATPGGPFRVSLAPAVLRATPGQRRFALAHEVSHVCGGDVVTSVQIPWTVCIPAGVTVATGWGFKAVIASTHGQGRLVLLGVAATLIMAGSRSSR